ELPQAYYRKLPQIPYAGLQSYQREEAAVFFGRGADIRRLYNQLSDVQPVILFSGKAVIGKTSLLVAGLMPRIESRYAVGYIRYQQGTLTEALAEALREVGTEHGLPQVAPQDQAALEAKIAELQQSVAASTGFAREVLEKELRNLTQLSGASLAFSAYWRMIEEKTGKPLVLILDEPRTLEGEWEEFLQALHSIFDEIPDQKPIRGKLILSLREAHHEPVSKLLRSAEVPFSEMFLTPMGWENVIEAIEGITQVPATRDYYRLQIENSSNSNLPETLAGDLLEGETSLVAPMLQVLMTELWKAALAENPKAPRMTLRMYQQRKHSGEIMDRFFQQQIQRLTEWRSDVVQSGLVLDLLYRHTTALGTADSLDSEELRGIYGSRSELAETLTARCRDFYLLTDVYPQGTSLAHNFLAPVVVRGYSVSVSPGQQASRILNSKIGEFQANENDVWLDEGDLEMVEKGAEGMRQFTDAETRLLEVSRQRKQKAARDRRRNRLVRLALLFVIVSSGGLSAWQWQVAERNYRYAQANQLAFKAREVAKTDNTLAMSIAWEAYHILGQRSSETVTEALSDIFHSQSLTPFYSTTYLHLENVNSAVFSADARQVLTASEDGSATLWDLNGKKVRDFGHVVEVRDAAFSPNGKQILTLTRDSVFLWELNGKQVDRDTVPETALLHNYSTDGTRIIPNFAEKEGTNYSVPLTDSAFLSTVAFSVFSQDGKQFLTVSYGDSSRISMWDDAGRLLRSFVYPGQVLKVAFAPDGNSILTSSTDRSAKRWDFSRPYLHRLPSNGAPVQMAVFSPDHQWILTANYNNVLQLWDMSGQRKDTLPLEGVPNEIAFSSDSKRIIVASRDGAARLWIPATSRVIVLPHKDQVKKALFSPDGTLILTASTDSTARLWTADGSPVDSFRHGGEVLYAAFSPDSKRILCTSSDSSAYLWTLQGHDLQRLRHPGEVSTAVFSPDGKQLLTASYDSTARLWDASGVPLHVFHDHSKVLMACFSPDGRRILTATDRVKIWDSKGRALDSLSHKGNIKSLVFAPDGKHILTASQDNSARLWGPKAQLLAIYPHLDAVNSARFSPDGSHLITASNDGYAIRWRVPDAIYQDIKKVPFYQLTQAQREAFGMVR
ncbi:MAG: hypothetical protein EAZ89_02255, partial [Bacteroidetes bacterium]